MVTILAVLVGFILGGFTGLLLGTHPLYLAKLNEEHN